MSKRKDERKQAFELYGQGLKLIEIARNLNIPEGTIRCWKQRDKWDAALQPQKCSVSKKRGGQPGNSGGAAPKENTNALKHGLFSKYFTKDTRDIYEELQDGKPLDLLWHNIFFFKLKFCVHNR